MPSHQYHLIFRRDYEYHVNCVREMVSMGFYHKQRLRQYELLQQLADVFAEHDGIAKPRVLSTTTGHSYNLALNTISLEKPSMVSFLHEYRHALQVRKRVRQRLGGEENDARAWSLSVFYRACPGSFRRSVQRGNIMFMTTDQL